MKGCIFASRYASSSHVSKGLTTKRASNYLIHVQLLYEGVHEVFHKLSYSRTPLTRTLKGKENLFELAGFRVIGVD